MGKEDNAGAEIRAADVSEQDTYEIGMEEKMEENNRK